MGASATIIPAKDSLVLKTQSVAPGLEWTIRTPAYCFLLLREGRAAFEAHASSRQLSSGDAVVMKMGSMATLRASSPKGFSSDYFYFFPPSLNGFLSLGERQLLETKDGFHADGPSFYRAGSPFARTFRAFVERPAPLGTLSYYSQVLQLVAIMLKERIVSGRPFTPQGDTAKARVISVLERVPESELQVLSVPELAAKCGCSRRHLVRLFHEHFGRSIAARKMELRIEKAAKLLSSSNAKVVDVALECGFSHLGQFSAKFRARYGATPAHWRQAILQRGKPAPARNNGPRPASGTVAGIWAARTGRQPQAGRNGAARSNSARLN